jgi:hypothetical protein
VMNPNRWRRNCDQAYRERVCRGSKHDMPRWCKGSAGPGGRYAHDLDDAEKSWIEQAGRRQESKQTLLVNHKAYLKEARIQVGVRNARATRARGYTYGRGGVVLATRAHPSTLGGSV